MRFKKLRIITPSPPKEKVPDRADEVLWVTMCQGALTPALSQREREDMKLRLLIRA